MSPGCPDFPCYYPDCPKGFVSKFNLRRHINVAHLRIRAHECPVCQKKMASKQNVKEHLYIHTGEKPFQCPLPTCGKRFRQASHLAFHKRTHCHQSPLPLCPPTASCTLLSLLSLNTLPPLPITSCSPPGGPPGRPAAWLPPPAAGPASRAPARAPGQQD